MRQVYTDQFPDLAQLGTEIPVAPPGPCRVLTTAMIAGGTGKSTTAAHLARYTAYGFQLHHQMEREALLGKRPVVTGGYLWQVKQRHRHRIMEDRSGQKVRTRRLLVVDVDPQGDQWRSLQIGDPPRRTLLDVYTGRCTVDDCIARNESNPHLHLIPATRDLEKLQIALGDDDGGDAVRIVDRIVAAIRSGRLRGKAAAQEALVRAIHEEVRFGPESGPSYGWLRSVLEPLREKYDRIYIDAPPSSFWTRQALVASDEVLCVCEASEKARSKVGDLLALVHRARKENPDLWPVGILITRNKVNNRSCEQVIKLIAEQYPKLLILPYVDEAVKIGRAIGDGVSVVARKPKETYGEILEEIFARELDHYGMELDHAT